MALFAQPDPMQQIQNALDETGLPARNLFGEIRTLNCNAQQDCATVQTNGFLSPKSHWFDKKSRAELPAVFQLPLFSVLLASAFIGTNDEKSPGNSSSRDFDRNRDRTGRT